LKCEQADVSWGVFPHSPELRERSR
jgi:hypothetical protein